MLAISRSFFRKAQQSLFKPLSTQRSVLLRAQSQRKIADHKSPRGPEGAARLTAGRSAGLHALALRQEHHSCSKAAEKGQIPLALALALSRGPKGPGCLCPKGEAQGAAGGFSPVLRAVTTPGQDADHSAIGIACG